MNAEHEEAYRAIGTPSIAQLKKMGIDEYDIPTAKAILKSMGIRK